MKEYSRNNPYIFGEEPIMVADGRQVWNAMKEIGLKRITHEDKLNHWPLVCAYLRMKRIRSKEYKEIKPLSPRMKLKILKYMQARESLNKIRV